MSNQTTKYIAIGAALLISLILAGRCFDNKQSQWEARIERVQAQSKLLQERAKRAEAESDSLAQVAATAAGQAGESAAVTDTLIVNLPPAETPGETQRDTIIVRLTDERDGFQVAYIEQLAATDRLRAALTAVTKDRDSLSAVLDARPSGRPWWLPRLGIGATTGLDTQGRPNTVAGVTMMWEVSFGGGP